MSHTLILPVSKTNLKIYIKNKFEDILMYSTDLSTFHFLLFATLFFILHQSIYFVYTFSYYKIRTIQIISYFYHIRMARAYKNKDNKRYPIFHKILTVFLSSRELHPWIMHFSKSVVFNHLLIRIEHKLQ